VSRLSTKHVVLGLLIERRGYGWDLQQRLDSRLGFLGLSESIIYRLLERLEEDGLIEATGPKKEGRTRGGAPRIMYCPTDQGHQEFDAWIARPSDRAVLRDELQAKLNVGKPGHLPSLLKVAEEQQRECIAELATLRRPALAQLADPEVPWEEAAVLAVEDFHVRWLQMLVDWLETICESIEERIERSAS
jgi:DNA-binding PadR family transcriptional regulator